MQISLTSQNAIRHKLLFACLCLAFTIFTSALGQVSFTNSGEILQLSGHYSRIQINNRPAVTNTFHFIALTASNGWSISATNNNDSKDWGLMHYDGTNIYTLTSDRGSLPAGFTNKFDLYGYVFPGHFYLPKDQDSVHLFLPWMAFHLTQKMIQDAFEHNGAIEMPFPWGWPRLVVGSYGFNWIIESIDNGHIIQQIDVVRDVALDLKTEEDELRRVTLDYPFPIGDRDEVLRQLKIRKNIPNDFVAYSYRCAEVFHTNGLSIPSATHFISFYPDFKKGGKIILGKYELHVDQIALSQNGQIHGIITPAKALVADFRYQATNSRTKFNYASYTLNAGGGFKPGNDPELLAQANDWLKHGPGYNSYKIRQRLILVGMFTVTVIFGGLLFFRLKPAKKL